MVRILLPSRLGIKEVLHSPKHPPLPFSPPSPNLKTTTWRGFILDLTQKAEKQSGKPLNPFHLGKCVYLCILSHCFPLVESKESGARGRKN